MIHDGCFSWGTHKDYFIFILESTKGIRKVTLQIIWAMIEKRTSACITKMKLKLKFTLFSVRM